MPACRSFYGAPAVTALTIAGLACMAIGKCTEQLVFGKILLSYDPWSLVAVTAAQIILGWNRRWTLASVAGGSVLGLAVAYWLPASRAEFVQPICIGLASFTTLVATALLSPKWRAQSCFILAAGLLVLVAQQVSESGQHLSTVTPASFDARAYLIDRSFGFDTVGLVLNALYSMPLNLFAAIIVPLDLVYMAILLAMACVVLLHLRARSPDWLLALAAFLLAGGIGGGLYCLFPAAGPRFVFPNYPLLPDPATLSLNPAPLAPQFIRNCMPSLHTTWALLMVMNMAGLGRALRWGARVFALLTVLATLALGQHYLIDLVVAVPFAVAVQSLARGLTSRTAPGPAALGGGLCVAAWLAMLVKAPGVFLAVPGLTMTAAILTVVCTAQLARIDARRTSAAQRPSTLLAA